MKIRKLLAIFVCLAGFCLPVIAQPAGQDATPAPDAAPAPAADTVPAVDGAKELDSASTQLMGRTTPQPAVQLAKAEFKFDTPPVVMQPAPFTVSFIGSDGKVMENYELVSDLVFDLTSIKGDFSLRLGNDEYKSGRYVVVPFRKVRLDKGSVKGTITFTQVFKNGKVGVSLARSTEANQTLLATADINVAFGPAVAVYIESNAGAQPVKAGTDVEMKVYAYNAQGDHIVDPPVDKITFAVTGQMSLNGKPAAAQFVLEPKDFNNGVAVIRAKAEKVGEYGLRLDSKKTFRRDGSGAWNATAFKVIPGDPKEVQFKLTDKPVVAATSVQITWTLVDAFGNKIDAKEVEAVLSPIPEEGTLFDGKPVAADGKVVLTTRPHSIQITKSGTYALTATNGKAQITIVAGRANVLDVVCPDKVVAGEALAIKMSMRDAYGNLATFEGPLKIESSLIENGSLDVTMKDNPEFETSVTPQKPGRYQIFVNGFKDPFIANVTVNQTPVSSVINEAGIKRFYGDRMIMVPVTFADEQGNAPENPMEFRFTVTPSENGRVAVQGIGLNTRLAAAEGGKGWIVTAYLRAGQTAGVLQLNPMNTESVAIAPEKGTSVTVPIARIVPERLTYSAPGGHDSYVRMDLEQNLGAEAGQLQYVNRLVQQYAGHNRIIVSWTVFSPAGAIRHELVYYRDWQRLDYQAWNLADAKRVRRVLWRQISAEQIKASAASGAGQFPGNREVYE